MATREQYEQALLEVRMELEACRASMERARPLLGTRSDIDSAAADLAKDIVYYEMQEARLECAIARLKGQIH
jgi:hypothetical protein